MNVFHILIKSSRIDADDQNVTVIQNHFVAIADRPSRAVALLEESIGWKRDDKISVEMASPQMVSPDMKLDMEAVWRI